MLAEFVCAQQKKTMVSVASTVPYSRANLNLNKVNKVLKLKKLKRLSRSAKALKKVKRYRRK